MKMELIKTKSTFNYSEYKALNEAGGVDYKIQANRKSGSYIANIYENEKLSYRIHKPYKLIRTPKTPSHYIFDDLNKLIGSLTKNGTGPTNISFKNNEYICYLVGLWDEGIKFVITKANEDGEFIQVGLSELGIKIYDSKAKYEIFALNRSDAELSMIATLFYDYIRFDKERKVTKGVSIIKVKTKKREFLDKYNPKFKENIDASLGGDIYGK